MSAELLKLKILKVIYRLGFHVFAVNRLNPIWDARIARGLCPNGHGELEQHDQYPKMKRCYECGFNHGNSD